MLLGDAILVPITEVGSVASAIGWAATCAAFLAMTFRASTRKASSNASLAGGAIAVLGLAVAIGLVLMKVVPIVPGHFTISEWIALAIWILLGAAAALMNRTGKESG
jgi:hypothetical protein